jgi:predicted amidohydrolase YtcJ
MTDAVRLRPDAVRLGALVALLCVALNGVASAAAPADHVFRNGRVYTVDSHRPWAEALAVRNGRIVYLGDNAGARAYVGRRTRRVNLRGRMVMPGLQDSHNHAIEGGASLVACSLDYLALTVPQFQERIQACLDEDRTGEPDAWLEVQNWSAEETNPKGTVITKQALDALDTRRPVIVYNADGHKSLVNSRGLALAGITAVTPDPAGGVIGRTPAGEPNGLLFEDAQAAVDRLIPDPSLADRVEWADAAVNSLNEAGVTSVWDPLEGAQGLRAYRVLLRRGDLTLRTQVGTTVEQRDAKRLPELLRRLGALRRAYHHPLLKARAAKIFADGVLEHPAQTASLLRPYLRNAGTKKNPRWVASKRRGLLLVKPAPFARLTTALNRAGWQVHVHAIGDRAVRAALNAFARSRRANHITGWGPRNTITHLELVDPADIPRFAALKVIPNMQMQWFQRDGFTIQAVQHYLGAKRFRWLYPAGSLVHSGARLAASSDWPVDPLFPWYAIERGVTRKADPWYGYAKRALNRTQRLSLAQAVRAYTMGSAFQMHQEGRTGSLERGKLADLIVLDRNLFRVRADRISGTKVLMTMLGGKVVHGDLDLRR